MEFQWQQLLIVFLWVIVVSSIFFSNKQWIKIVGIILAFVIFTMNPFRMTATPIQRIEGTSNKFNSLPDKVVVEHMSFEDRQKSNMDTLKHNQEETHEKINDEFGNSGGVIPIEL